MERLEPLSSVSLLGKGDDRAVVLLLHLGGHQPHHPLMPLVSVQHDAGGHLAVTKTDLLRVASASCCIPCSISLRSWLRLSISEANWRARLMSSQSRQATPRTCHRAGPPR